MFSRTNLANIFAGTLTSWADPVFLADQSLGAAAILQALADPTINVVVRSDGSSFFLTGTHLTSRIRNDIDFHSGSQLFPR